MQIKALFQISKRCVKMSMHEDIERLKKVLQELRKEGKISLAYLFGSSAKGGVHKRSDIDIAVYFSTQDEREVIELIDRILITCDRDVEILRLDDEDESPFIVQEALKGIPLVVPDEDTYYRVCHRVLHEAEGIRFRRGMG